MGKSSGSSSASSGTHKGFDQQQMSNMFNDFMNRMGWGSSSGTSQSTGTSTSNMTGVSDTNTQGQSNTQNSGTSTSSTVSPYAAPLAKFGQMEQNVAAPILKQYGAQTAEALRTGGVNAQIPIIGRSTDAARQALSGSNEALRQNLARSGMGGSAAGAATIAQANQQGEEGIAGIAPGVASQFIAGAPSFGTSVAGQGSGALGQAMQGNITTKGSYANQSSNQYSQQSETKYQQQQQTQFQEQQAFQQAYQDFVNQQNQGTSQGINQNYSSGVGTNQGSQSSSPSFWDLFNQGLGSLAQFFNNG